MPSRNPKLSSWTQKRLIRFDLLKERNTRETKRDESIPEIEIKLVNPHRDLQRSELCHWEPYRMVLELKTCFMKVWKPFTAIL